VTGYVVQRAADETFEAGVETFAASAAATGHTDADAQSGGAYFYRVCTESEAGWSPWSTPVQVTVP
jgi:fibronectin type 3 domain-containing protein